MRNKKIIFFLSRMASFSITYLMRGGWISEKKIFYDCSVMNHLGLCCDVTLLFLLNWKKWKVNKCVDHANQVMWIFRLLQSPKTDNWTDQYEYLNRDCLMRRQKSSICFPIIYLCKDKLYIWTGDLIYRCSKCGLRINCS